MLDAETLDQLFAQVAERICIPKEHATVLELNAALFGVELEELEEM
jgi:hypothetical protein